MREVSKPAASEKFCRGSIWPAFIYSTGINLVYRHPWLLYPAQPHQRTSSMGSAAECHDSTQANTVDCLLKFLLAGHFKECLNWANGSPSAAATLRLL